MLFGIAAKPLAVEGAFFGFFVANITGDEGLYAVCLRLPSAARKGAGENPSTDATNIAASTDTRPRARRRGAEGVTVGVGRQHAAHCGCPRDNGVTSAARMDAKASPCKSKWTSVA